MPGRRATRGFSDVLEFLKCPGTTRWIGGSTTQGRYGRCTHELCTTSFSTLWCRRDFGDGRRCVARCHLGFCHV